MDSAFGTNDGLGVGVASALTPSQVQGWAFNHDSPSGLQDAAAAAAAAGGLGLGLGGLGVGGPEQFRNIQVALEQVNRVQSLAREVMFGMWVFHFLPPPRPPSPHPHLGGERDWTCKLRPCRLMMLTEFPRRNRENAYQPTTHVSRTARKFFIFCFMKWNWRVT